MVTSFSAESGILPRSIRQTYPLHLKCFLEIEGYSILIFKQKLRFGCHKPKPDFGNEDGRP
jgi:hypothetical protein